jgi:hypothetical protein
MRLKIRLFAAMKTRRKLLRIVNIWPMALVGLCIILCLAWAGLLVWLPLRLLHVI